jgi:hypothetical protein
MADKLMVWHDRLMHRSGCLSLIKLTLASILVYTAISHSFPPWVIKVFTKIFCAFLWAGSDSDHGGKCLLAWDMVQHPLVLGELGIHDPKLMGHALRLRWL